MKKDAWNNIEDEFNSQSLENHRTATVLKYKYENIKRNVKKQFADEKMFNRGTGGGPPKTYPSTSISTTIGEILQIKMTGESAFYDSDKKPTLESNLVEEVNIDGTDIFMPDTEPEIIEVFSNS